ncbi:ergothioneine biosynthesis protein EgtC [Salinisphaera sp. USBA-960]|nr:ergothioneine biosynthesis protein EgtC [Salifodinibacter halophilus]NNC26246.1 ergothioneine biosynthesis protein EgtC [Salifodinibacter halophilus]
MCRIAAYLGEPCRLDRFLTEPAHSIARQAWDAREMGDATVNADGWGTGWFDESGQPAAYRNTLPIWSDANVDALGRSLYAHTWVTNVRSATPGLGTDYANTQPFISDEVLFVHNGFVDRFAHTLRARVSAALEPAMLAEINGSTDSEYLFALFRQQTGSLADRLRAMHDQVVAWMPELGDDVRALLNFIVTDGTQLAAIRNAVNAPAPSLYLNRNWSGGAVIASEAFDQSSGWTPMPHNEVVELDHPVSPRNAA